MARRSKLNTIPQKATTGSHLEVRRRAGVLIHCLPRPWPLAVIFTPVFPSTLMDWTPLGLDVNHLQLNVRSCGPPIH